MAQVLKMRRTGRPVRFENRLLNADGTWRWIAWLLSPLPNGESMIGVGRDITQEKASREEILLANRQLQDQIEERERVEAELRQVQRLEAVGQLTSGVAHDFNNLLTVIIGALELLERAPGHPSTPRRLAMIRGATERGATLTGQLLAFARKQRLNPRPIDLNDAIVGMNDLLRGTIGGTVRLEVTLTPNLWPALADQAQLELVVLNLAINARDAMPVGGPLTIETANTTLGLPRTPHDPPAGDYVVVCVTDQGTGMPQDVLERAFEPFFTTKGPGKGSGLGLAQVYGFAKQSGGGVRIETRVGHGTSIRVFLPRARCEPAAVARDTMRAAVYQNSRPNLLLVDDDTDVREVTAAMLDGFGYQVTTAASGPAALGILDGGTMFDLCLFDFAMPGMNGVELARRVEQLCPSLPVVFVTGYADMKALEDIGGRPVVLKPFKPDSLAAALRDAMRAGEVRGTVLPFPRGAVVGR
jgi:signal transduction histidine kinase/ActR/RegA family two-component response regulator